MHIARCTHSVLTSMPFNHVPVCGLQPSKNIARCVWGILQSHPLCLCSINSWPHFYLHASLHQFSNHICQTCTMINNNISNERPHECARLWFLATEFLYKRNFSSAGWHLVKLSRRSRKFRNISCGEYIISEFNTIFFCVLFPIFPEFIRKREQCQNQRNETSTSAIETALLSLISPIVVLCGVEF